MDKGPTGRCQCRNRDEAEMGDQLGKHSISATRNLSHCVVCFSSGH